ncbi:enoyl-CoA hydratase-related protein [Megasphaera butyrica]|uniref:enoyl-CoA hydratase/isomerase family protein n=1 Tax=Megasphaera butyrica TaxID=2981791 RepID=UPI000820C3A7|nr:enoyl-CoA hydratase-related protein [Megasphaera butyrica]MCU6714173.1 enoyl-CoA hydratase-related protein [Megasphaera butyrica]SCH42090.1 4-chlorobenzoyl coenzyme A dehalogenase [uncultured Megasphaera sp.]SCJ08258.1 4-chlorobenzoyl coenzyme A dehalogenase [uncultured Ruminococcus sp.]
MELQKLIYTVEDGIAVVTMNYMKNLNAIDEQMADELMYVVDKAEHDPDVRVLVIKGAEKAFSAGGDIGYFYKLIQAGGEVNMDGLISKVGNVADGLKKMSKIVITSVSGAAAGAGVSLAIGGDFMICADNAKFILAFVNLGLVPDTGATYLLTRLIGPNRTMELAATGRPVGAEEAKALGLAYKVTTVEELDSVTMAFAKKIAAGPLLSYKNIKKQIYDAMYVDYKKWLDETEVPTQRECSASMDFQEGCKAFMEKRKAIFQGK